MVCIRLAYSNFLFVLAGIQVVLGVQQCSMERGGGICPDGNTCCQRRDGSTGCIALDMGMYDATCCPDGETGCPVGYACNITGEGCYAVNQTEYTDSLVQVLPRYRLCNAQGIENIYGMTLDEGAQLAYFSSHGPIEAIPVVNQISTIDMALVVIHGANRNGDDYFCASRAAAALQSLYKDVLVVAPQFYAESDARPMSSLLYWDDDNDGSWRYGADALGPKRVSSFTALDTMNRKIMEVLPTLTRIVIAGHSSGGQTVQRWILLTPVWNTEKMWGVVANPSSYAYLSSTRLVNATWTTPTNCHQYDKWEWGLSKGGAREIPYRNRVAHNVSEIIFRFKDRRITYLAGSQDRCNVSESHGWCHSHGLETTCMDELQGANRLERSTRYITSLRLNGFGDTHTRRIVPSVGHDHAMIFQSRTGIEALFGRSNDQKVPTRNTNIAVQ